MPSQQTQQNGLVGSTINWFAHPFQSQGSALNWILFVGLLIVAAWGWNHVLLQIQQEI
jgi:hypothetical protein